MASPASIRAHMLQRATRLTDHTNTEEAWHLISLFQQTQPATFMSICHRILASFLELTHDHFDRGWPVRSRLHPTHRQPPSTTLPPSNHQTPQQQQNGRTTCCYCSECESESIQSDVQSLLMMHTPPRRVRLQPRLGSIPQTPTDYVLSPSIGNGTNTPGTTTAPTTRGHLGSKLRNLASKRLFKQILLPSKQRTPIDECSARLETQAAKLSCLEMTLARSRTNCPTRNGPRNLRTLASTWGCHFGATSRLDTTVPLLTPSGDNVDSLICRYLIDYMLHRPAICATQGLFRVPGNAHRIRELWLELRDHFQHPYLRETDPSPFECSPDHHQQQQQPKWSWNVTCSILDAYSPHDLASLLLRCLSRVSLVDSRASNTSTNGPFSTSTLASPVVLEDKTSGFSAHQRTNKGGLLAPQISELCFMATQLQYDVREVASDGGDGVPDWVSELCRARQLLAYRIILQLLLPTPERQLLSNLLRLFRRVADQHRQTTRMSAECVARCTAFAVFGPPTRLDGVTTTATKGEVVSQLTSSDGANNPLRWRIDTLTNWIELSDESLAALPNVVYSAVQHRLRAHFGHSPVPRSRITPSCTPTAIDGRLDWIDWQDKEAEGEEDDGLSMVRRKRSRRPRQFRHTEQIVCTVNELLSKEVLQPTANNSELSTNENQPAPHIFAPIRLVKVQSTLDSLTTTSPSIASTRINDSNHTSLESFKFWRRQKPTTQTNSAGMTTPKDRLLKVRSSSSIRSYCGAATAAGSID